jgi:hypothetical protein
MDYEKQRDRVLAGKPILEVSALAKEVGIDALKGAATVAGGLAAASAFQTGAQKIRARKFKDTVVGQDLYKRLKNAIESLQKLKSKKSEISPNDFRERAKKLENRISKLKKQIAEKERSY